MTDLEKIASFLPISDLIATAGQPSPEQFASIKAAGYELIINLAMPTSTNYLPNERELVEAQGMEYMAIPVDWEAPSSADAARFFEAMNANRHRKVFVHCALNMRVSAFMFLYRVLHQAVPEAEAQRDLNRIWTPNATWAHFIETTLRAC